MHTCILLTLFLLCFGASFTYGGSFKLANDQFMYNGQPIRLLSGSIHPARIPRELWRDHLERCLAMGLNAIQMYVPWQFHEEYEGEYDFEGQQDVFEFLRIADELGLLVLLRAGPYICGEWEYGGLPAWILKHNASIEIRTYSHPYIFYVERWWATLLPRLVPFLIQNGGPIVMVQVENEYGSYGDVSQQPNDKKYLEFLVGLARHHLGQEVVLYTTDGGSVSYMQRGSLNGSAVYTVGDGGDFNTSFAAQKQFNPPGLSPPFISEFYTGWLTHWSENSANTSSTDLAKNLDALLTAGGSVSLYMAHGGTNFAFFNGANGAGINYNPTITSYDYDAPISEDGTHGYGSDGMDKYQAVQEVLKKYAQGPLPKEPEAPHMTAYPPVTFTHQATLLDNLPQLSEKVFYTGSGQPGYMAQYDQSFGYLALSIMISNCSKLNFSEVHDRVHVFVQKELQGILYRAGSYAPRYGITLRQESGELILLVENMGRINYGKSGMATVWKGVKNVSCDGTLLNGNWTVHSLPLFPSSFRRLHWKPLSNNTGGFTPTFYRGGLHITGEVEGTYVNTTGWGKGVVFANEQNLGRYWEIGPQVGLYSPAPFLYHGYSEFVVFETDHPPPSTPSLPFSDHQIWKLGIKPSLPFNLSSPSFPLFFLDEN